MASVDEVQLLFTTTTTAGGVAADSHHQPQQTLVTPQHRSTTTTSQPVEANVTFFRPTTPSSMTSDKDTETSSPFPSTAVGSNTNTTSTKRTTTTKVDLPLSNVKPIAMHGGHQVAPGSHDIVAKARAFASLYNHSSYSQEKPPSPIKLIRLNNQLSNNNNNNNNSTADAQRAPSKPILAIVTATRSAPSFNTSENTFLYRYLISSIRNTTTIDEYKTWDIRLYIAVDDNDVWWQHHCNGLASLLPPWLHVIFGVYPKQANHVPFNEIAYTAYQEGAEYFCRVNDDTEILTAQWITNAVATLQSYRPPNIGVTGPRCLQGNIYILTHDFVHRTHMEIFEGFYYPKAFNNWYLDDWMSTVYSSEVLGDEFGGRFTILESFQVKHWMSVQRYISNSVDAQLLPVEFQRGRQLIRNYLEKHYHDTRVPQSNPRPQLVDVEYADAVQAVIPKGSTTTTILVWGLGIDSHYWHDLTGGDVVFLNERTMITNWEVKHRHLWLRAKDVRHEATERGTLAAHEWNYQTFVQGQTWDNNNNTWCDLEMAQFPPDVTDSYWNVILIAPPFGRTVNETYGPGSLQALYMSQKLAVQQMIRKSLNDSSVETHVFVQNYERATEHDFSHAVFGKEPHQVIRVGHRAYAHFVLNREDKVVLLQRSSPSHCRPPPIRDVLWISQKPWNQRHVSAILHELPRKGNLLIWGMSDGSSRMAQSTTGRVVYLDNNRTRSSNGALERYQVRFPVVQKEGSLDKTSLMNEWDRHKWDGMLNMTQETHNLPIDKLRNIAWDVILLFDGHVHEYGHLQALYLSHVLAQNSQVKLGASSPCHVFLLNYHGNSTVGKFATVLFGQRPSNIVENSEQSTDTKDKKPAELAHFVVGTETSLQHYRERLVRQGRIAPDVATTH